MEILIPTGRAARRADAGSGEAGDIRGKRVAILNNGWLAMGIMQDQITRRLQEQYGVGSVIHEEHPISSVAPTEVLDRVAASADLAIVGLAT